MSYSDDDGSDETSDPAWNDLIDNVETLELTDKKELQKDWDAVEQTLYLEEGLPVLLKPPLYNECHLWRTSFPYIRVRGQRIEDPNGERKQRLKHRILTALVDSIINKMNDNTYVEREEKVISPVKKESYFERGKEAFKNTTKEVPKKTTKNAPKKIPLREKLSEQDSYIDESTESSGTPRKPTRGILKNSPSRQFMYRSRERRKNRENTTSNRTSLPKISTNSNNWLNRSENCICGAKLPTSSLKTKSESKVVLPALSSSEFEQ